MKEETALIDTILQRRSIRKFTDTPLTQEEITQILRAGMTAPSARNARPWRFIVVDQRPLMEEMRKVHPYSSPLDTAPLAIVVCGAPAGADWYDDYWQQDCGACTENMLLAAHAMGLGGVWMGIYPDQQRRDSFRQLLALPQEVEAFCVLAFGHPAEEGRRPDCYDPALIHYNRW